MNLTEYSGQFNDKSGDVRITQLASMDMEWQKGNGPFARKATVLRVRNHAMAWCSVACTQPRQCDHVQWDVELPVYATKAIRFMAALRFIEFLDQSLSELSFSFPEMVLGFL